MRWRLAAAFVLLSVSTGGMLLALVWQLSWWSLLVGVGALLVTAGLFARVLAPRRAKPILLAGAVVLAGPFVLRAVTARGTEGHGLITLPGARGMRLIDRLVPERDGVLAAAGMMGWVRGLDDDEIGDLRPILARAYDRIDVPALRLPTPAIATYLGLESPNAFDVVVISPRAGEGSRAPSGALLFLHGFAGGFYVYCWELAQAAREANLLTICPSFDASGAWWTPRGEQTLLETLSYLRARGMKRIYLAGLSNGAAAASVFALQHERELKGLILISGTREQTPPALPTLVIQGARDRMMPATLARAYADRSRHVRYHEIPGGHFVLLSKHELVRPLIAEFLRANEM